MGIIANPRLALKLKRREGWRVRGDPTACAVLLAWSGTRTG
jgi:hypothetical protein